MTPPAGPSPGTVAGTPAILLRLEGLAVFAGALVVYAALAPNWWLFAALILAPDLAMLGYLAGPVLGARLYNGVHSYIGPALLAALAYSLADPHLGAVAAIWVAHIGIDRALGYGLKYPDSFGHTHLGKLGTAGKPGKVRVDPPAAD
ncbi:DUF4260 domain-containing protein [Ancylobacter pratisalsi]|uniref:DUF4260 domain-containing protein n=1 Tax=Ancylobacter pratisalsi TaxID=1745854 RepID=A0A6P1YJD9_9HYPH|nr:DUF4260 domain-containing protein [Ancylobacter pratisalsi]QIB33409.1 DUF4260 domain-containing protein [Ancylobacter pratisalsi]